MTVVPPGRSAITRRSLTGGWAARTGTVSSSATAGPKARDSLTVNVPVPTERAVTGMLSASLWPAASATVAGSAPRSIASSPLLSRSSW